MADLPTSLRLAKMALNGGELPPMTPVPENIQHFIDPAFTIGMGALRETESGGLQCPVRGCGRFFHALSTHLNLSHADIGGANRIKEVLQLPRTSKLISARRFASISEVTRKRFAEGRVRGFTDEERARAYQRRRERGWRSMGKAGGTVGVKNLRNVCEAQLASRLLACEQQLGRTPSQAEASQLDRQMVIHGVRLYGTWNAFLATVGLVVKYKRAPRLDRYSAELVVETVRAWYEAHGHLPEFLDSTNPSRLPLIPTATTIMKYMGTDSYPEAMRRIAALLNIYGGRYGLPEKARPKKQAVAA